MLERVTTQTEVPRSKMNEWLLSILASQFVAEKCMGKAGKATGGNSLVSQLRIILTERGRDRAGYLLFNPIYLCATGCDNDLLADFRALLGMGKV